ncbi:MAG: hypothetical protein ACE5JG_04545 [Planctomycetota bacterium]
MSHARAPAVVSELTPLAEAGMDAALEALLDHFGGLDLRTRERVLVGVAGGGRARHRSALLRICRSAPLDAAAVAAEGLLAAGDASGVFALLGRKSAYARACGCALSLRLTRLAGPLQVVPRSGPAAEEVLDAAARALSKRDAMPWSRFGDWVRVALTDPARVLRWRRDHVDLRVGRDRVRGERFAAHHRDALRAGEYSGREVRSFMRTLLSPQDPGRGIPARPLAALLDALQRRCSTPELKRDWIDNLIVMACAQYGLADEAGVLKLVHERLKLTAGEGAPEGAARKPALLWAAWADERFSKKTGSR